MKQKTKSRLAKFLLGLVIVILVLAIGMIGLLIALFHRPAVYHPHQFTPAEMERIEQAGWVKYNQLYNQVNLDEPFTLSYDDRLLNALLLHPDVKRFLDRAAGGQVRNPQVGFAPGRITLLAEVNYRGSTAILNIGVRPSITPEGMLRLRLESPRAGLLPVPEDLYRKPLQKLVETLRREEKTGPGTAKPSAPDKAEVRREIKAQFLPKLEELLTKREVTLDAIFTPAPERCARITALKLEKGRIDITLQPAEK